MPPRLSIPNHGSTIATAWSTVSWYMAAISSLAKERRVSFYDINSRHFLYIDIPMNLDRLPVDVHPWAIFVHISLESVPKRGFPVVACSGKRGHSFLSNFRVRRVEIWLHVLQGNLRELQIDVEKTRQSRVLHVCGVSVGVGAASSKHRCVLDTDQFKLQGR